jgi:hypothetical protein
MTQNEINKRVSKIIERFSANVSNELIIIWNDLDIDLTKKEIYEVLTGLIARQITLATHFMKCPNLWTGDLGPIILRSMIDNYINFAWIIKEPLERSRKYILYGLGQEKLIIEHRKNEIISEGSDPKDDILVKYSEAWMNSQRFSFFTEVNIGSWSGISVREMAEQANCLDFYNYSYLPFSSVVHNMWNHINRYNLKTSENPLHKFLLIPKLPEVRIIIEFIEIAARYVDKMLQTYDENFPCKTKRKSSYAEFLKSYNSLMDKMTNESS